MKSKFSLVTIMSGVLLWTSGLSSYANAEIVRADPKSPTPNVLDAKLANEKQAERMATAALQVLSLIDQGKGNEVWVGLSPVIKPLVTQSSFVQRIANDQSTFGNAGKRNLLSAYRSDANGQTNIPQGIYYNVAFLTQFSKGQGRELISFRLDNDQTWRVAGYSLTRVEGQ